MAQHGVIGWVVQRQQPALAVPLASLGRGARDGLRRHAGKLRLALDRQAPGIGSILHVVLERGLGCRQFLHDRLEAGLRVRGQVDAGQVEITQGLADDALLGRRSILAEPGFDGRVGFLQGRVLAQLRRVLGQQRQRLVVSLSPLTRSQDALQVADRRPGPRELVFHVLDPGDEAVEAPGRLVVEQVGEILPMCCDKLADRGDDMLGSNFTEAWQ